MAESLEQIHRRTGGDKGTVHSYLEAYEELLSPYRFKDGNVLEVGVFRGESMRMWEQYFPAAVVYGIDLCDQPLGLADLRPMLAECAHRIVFMDAANPVEVERNFGGMRFNVIIEDAGHHPDQQLAIYRNFRDKLAPGGVYIIEDIADLDSTRAVFEGMDPTRTVTIIDRRAVKGRFDDVLVVVR